MAAPHYEGHSDESETPPSAFFSDTQLWYPPSTTPVKHPSKATSHRTLRRDLSDSYIFDPNKCAQGSFCRVYPCQLRADPTQERALKIISKAKMMGFSPRGTGENLWGAAAVRREIEILSQNRDTPGIVHLYEVLETDAFIVLVEECLLPLHPETDLNIVGFLVLFGIVARLHEQNVLHRDLHPANIMVKLDAAGCRRLTLVDFGLAKLLEKGSSLLTPLSNDLTKAPELTEGFRNAFLRCFDVDAGDLDSVKADIWSLGIIFLRTFAVPTLQDMWTTKTVVRHLFNGTFDAKLQESFPDNIKAQNLARKLLQLVPALRPSASEAKEFAFFETAY